MEHDDEWYRLQGRLNALENLLLLLVIDRANVSPDPSTWITQYVANLRLEKETTLIGSDRGAEIGRIAAEVHKAVLEIADGLECQYGAVISSRGVEKKWAISDLGATYFHCAPLPLLADSVVEPGNWGRIIRMYTPNDGATFAVAYRESLLEHFRQRHCPNKPSRLNCVFACPSVEIAQAYKAKWGRLNFIYEVEQITPAGVHLGDYELALFQSDVPYFDNFPDRAALYWSDDPKQNPEVLLPGPVRILQRVG
jgi:hypothetical protein